MVLTSIVECERRGACDADYTLRSLPDSRARVPARSLKHMSNKNYYTGIDPLARVLAAKERLIAAEHLAANARRNVAGEMPALPEGYVSEESGWITQNPGVLCDGYGLDTLSRLTPAPEHGQYTKWTDTLTPDRLLAITIEIERQVDAMVRELDDHAAQCVRVSAMHLMEHAQSLTALTSREAVAAKLQTVVDALRA